MAAEKLHFKDVPSIPHLKVADFTTSEGVKVRAFSMGPNTIHLVPHAGSDGRLGEMTVTGSNVTTIAFDISGLPSAITKFIRAMGGVADCHNKTTTHVDVDITTGTATITTVTECVS